MSKLRDALLKADVLISIATFDDGVKMDEVDKIRSEIKSALAEPVLNCEVGTAEEQAKRFDVYCHTGGGLCSSIDSCAECTIAWMHMPYESEVTK
jgi:hypothetical protein